MKWNADNTVGLLAPLAVLPFFFMIVVRAWVFAQLWAWYLVPRFHIPPLRVVEAFGLLLIISFAWPGQPDKPEKPFWERVVEGFMRWMLFLLFGWVGTWWL